MITGTALFNKITALIKDSMRHNMQPYNKQLHLLNTVAYNVYRYIVLSSQLPFQVLKFKCFYTNLVVYIEDKGWNKICIHAYNPLIRIRLQKNVDAPNSSIRAL